MTRAAATLAAAVLALVALATPAQAHDRWCGHGKHRHYVSVAPTRLEYKGARVTKWSAHEHSVLVVGPGYSFWRTIDCPRHR